MALNDSITDSAKFIWVFNSPRQPLSGGLFESKPLAETWIKKNKLTGMLTKYPVNQGVLDWAIQNKLVNMKPEKLDAKKDDPDFVGGFTSASMEHYHYENGKRE